MCVFLVSGLNKESVIYSLQREYKSLKLTHSHRFTFMDLLCYTVLN